MKEEPLAVAVGLEVSNVGLIAESLTESLLESSRIGMKLTEKGKAAAEKVSKINRGATDLAALETFIRRSPINQDYKKSVSSWQIKTVGDSAEPKQDAECDQQVLKMF